MPKRELQGIVVSAKSHKTVIVKVERRVSHKLYKKIVKVSKRYAAHDPDSKYSEGDVVNIIEHAPISKTKRWLVI